jgi:signal transduction histidine kinase/CheY-like chemotaxis protein
MIKIAVIDDEEIMRKLVSDILETEGYEVESFNDPKVALEKLKTEKFDFLLTDIKMPELDGIELVKKVHQINPETGAIFMTGYADLASTKEALKEGAYDYILKPFDLNVVRNSVAKAIEKRNISEEKARARGITPLLDLDQEIYKSGDKDSLLKLTLNFALMQTGIQKGSILLWDEESQNAKIFLITDLNKGLSEKIELEIDSKIVENWFELKDMIKISELEKHPIFSLLFSLYPELSIWKKIIEKDETIFSIAVIRDKKVFELLNLNCTKRTKEIPESSLKLLSFVASQTALSIENLLLLEESKKSLKELEGLQDQIIQLDRMATKALQSAEIGHELNNYLSVVMGNLQMLTLSPDKDEPEKRRKILDTMDDYLQKMAKFACGLMDFGSLKSEKKEGNLNQLIEKTLSFIRSQNKFKNISIDTGLDQKVPFLFLDADQIQQLLYNLLNNASDAVGKRKGEGGVIAIETFLNRDESFAELVVSDTGKGMSAEELGKVFKTRFTTKETGHGFGLIACKKIVDNHQGEITVKSQYNQGTTFRIKLPLKNK